MKKFVFLLAILILSGCGATSVLAQTNASILYVPLIGITSVPEPLALPKGPGVVTYHYAVKNFLGEVALTDIKVADDKCAPVVFVEGDDNADAKIDFSETWRYTCTTTLSTTTNSTATAQGTAHDITATHRAYATVVVGSATPAPLVSIINVTKVAYPLSLPPEGGLITFTYKVNNPGVVPLHEVVVVDDKCSAMSGKLGDTNGNNLLDTNEVWIYTCAMRLTKTTTNTVAVTAYANGFKATSDDTITVRVDSPAFPIVGGSSGGATIDFKTTVWAALSGVLAVLGIYFLLTRTSPPRKKQ